jgi:hypothetical protein
MEEFDPTRRDVLRVGSGALLAGATGFTSMGTESPPKSVKKQLATYSIELSDVPKDAIASTSDKPSKSIAKSAQGTFLPNYPYTNVEIEPKNLVVGGIKGLSVGDNQVTNRFTNVPISGDPDGVSSYIVSHDFEFEIHFQRSEEGLRVRAGEEEITMENGTSSAIEKSVSYQYQNREGDVNTHQSTLRISIHYFGVPELFYHTTRSLYPLTDNTENSLNKRVGRLKRRVSPYRKRFPAKV